MYNITAILFKRKENSEFGPGLLFDEGKIIIDQGGKTPETIWGWKRYSSVLSLSLTGVFSELERYCCKPLKKVSN
jgi:hypothetical protein